MSGKKLSKEDVKGPDSFVMLSDRIVEAIENNVKPILIVVAFAVIGSGLFVGSTLYTQNKEDKASQSLYAAFNQLEEKKEELEDEEIKSLDLKEDKKKTKAKEVAKESPEDKKKRELEVLQPLLENVRNQVALFKDTQSGAAAAIEAAAAFAEYDQLDEAQKILHSVEERLSSDEMLYGLIQSQLGTIKAEADKCQEAIKHFDRVVDNQKHLHLHPDILLRKGLCFEKLNDTEQAKTTYKKVEKDHAGTDAARTAKTYIKLLDLGITPSEG